MNDLKNLHLKLIFLKKFTSFIGSHEKIFLKQCVPFWSWNLISNLDSLWKFEFPETIWCISETSKEKLPWRIFFFKRPYQQHSMDFFKYFQRTISAMNVDFFKELSSQYMWILKDVFQSTKEAINMNFF